MAQVESEKGPLIDCGTPPAPYSEWWQQLSAMTNPPAVAVKMFLDGANHELPLVAIAAADASRVRFYDGAIKALKLYLNIYKLILDEEYWSVPVPPDVETKIDEEYWSVPVPPDVETKIDEEYRSVPVLPDEEQKIDEEYISVAAHPTERLSSSVYVSLVAVDP